MYIRKKIFQLLPLLLLTVYSCASLQNNTFMGNKASRNARFYTPKNWQIPINKNRPAIENNNAGVAKRYDYTGKTPANVPQQEFQQSSRGNIPQPDEQMVGIASWYGPNFHGLKTANGEIYNQYEITAAHKFLPINSIVRVRNRQNGLETIVRINDRGPYVDDRIIDLSRAAAEKIKMIQSGTAPVKLEVIKYPHNFDKAAGIKAYKQSVVQLAVFNNPKNADYYKAELSRKYRNLSFFVDNPKHNSYQVVIGPFDNRKDAKNISENLRNDGQKSLVRSYRK